MYAYLYNSDGAPIHDWNCYRMQWYDAGHVAVALNDPVKEGDTVEIGGQSAGTYRVVAADDKLALLQRQRP